MDAGGGISDEHPEYDLLPSDYFRRQMYGSFWFEGQPALGSPGRRPREYADEVLGDLTDQLGARVLHGNAAVVYGPA